MQFEEYQRYDAVGLSELIKKKEIAPHEPLEAAIARCEEINPDINAVTYTMFEQAKDALNTADLNSALYGVPFLLKDLTAAYAGVPMTNGSRFFADYVPSQDTEIVTRYKKAGLAIMGKTNTPEFGSNWVTESVLLGACRNPFDLTKTPGGSSGGSAAAVAAGIVPIAHASDGGGSIRVPASCCGLIGLKPSRGRVPIVSADDTTFTLSVHHALTRSVRDSALLLDLTKSSRLSGPASYLQAIEEKLPQLRIGLVTQPTGGYPVDSDCLKAVQSAAKQCEALGFIVDDIKLTADGDALKQATNTVWCDRIATILQARSVYTGIAYSSENVELNNLFMANLGFQLKKGAVDDAMVVMTKATQDMTRIFEHYDLLLTPTLAQLPVDIGYLFYEESKGTVDDFYKKRGYGFSPFTSLFNVTGQPAISLPLYKSQAGLPVGVQFAARFGEESLLLRLANQLLG